MITKNQEKVLSLLRSEGICATDARKAAWSLIECAGASICIKEYAMYLVSNMHLNACDELIDELSSIAAYSGSYARIAYSRCIDRVREIRESKIEKTNMW